MALMTSMVLMLQTQFYETIILRSIELHGIIMYNF